MKKFEYEIFDIRPALDFSDVECLNVLGLQGWELVDIRSDFIYKPNAIFKREIGQCDPTTT